MMSLLQVNTPQLTWMLTGAAIFTVITLLHQSILNWLRSVISAAFNLILLQKYPIRNVETGQVLPSLPYLFPNGQGNVEKFLQGRANSAKWEAEYGGIYRLWSGMKGEVVLTKPAHIETVFRDSHLHSKAEANNSGYLMDRLLGSCLGLISGKPWRNVKAAVEGPFVHTSIDGLGVDAQVFTRQYMEHLGKESEAFIQHGNIHPVADLKLLPFLFVARIVYGPLEATLEKELKELIPLREDLFKTVIGGGITRFPLSRFLPLPKIRQLWDFKERWAAWSDRAHAQALTRTGAVEAPIIAMYRAVDSNEMTREQLLQTLDEMLFANIDVTMGGLSWTLVFLAAHSAVQKDLRDEISRHCADEATRHAYLTSSWSKTPTLLGACILESARLRPLAAFSVPQSCPTARNLDGFEIPAHTNFIVDSYALNIRDPFWGEDREKFYPERWLERHKSGRDLRYRYWRFGFGPRTCLGKYVAELMLRAVVVEIVENWHIQLESMADKRKSKGEKDGQDDEMNWPWDDEMWIHHPDLLLRCQPVT